MAEAFRVMASFLWSQRHSLGPVSRQPIGIAFETEVEDRDEDSKIEENRLTIIEVRFNAKRFLFVGAGGIRVATLCPND